MVKKEEVERLMLRYFPSCPLCGANAGYEVSGFFKRVVQCRSCGAKWFSKYSIKRKEVNALTLWEPDKEGKSKFLVSKKKPVSFWQSLDLEHERLDFERERSEKERARISFRGWAILLSNQANMNYKKVRARVFRN